MVLGSPAVRSGHGQPEMAESGKSPLSGHQFGAMARILNNPHPEYGSGFSKDPVTGDRITDSYMVGGLTSAPERAVNRPMRGSEIRSYVESNPEAFSAPNVAIGGWSPAPNKGSSVGSSFGGHAVLDASTAFPATADGRFAAAMSGIAAGEDAVGILDSRGEYAGEIDTTTGMMAPKSAPKGFRHPANVAKNDARKRDAQRSKSGG